MLFLDSIDVTYINLFEKNIDFCKGCRKCLETTECVFKNDDMPEIRRQIKEADIIFLAAPVYWANVPAINLGLPVLYFYSEALKILFFHASEFWQDSAQHGNKTKTAANDIGYRVCQKNAICSHMHYIGHQIS